MRSVAQRITTLCLHLIPNEVSLVPKPTEVRARFKSAWSPSQSSVQMSHNRTLSFEERAA